MKAEERFELIIKELQEIVGEQTLKDILEKRDLKIYWGTAPTGKPNIGYFVPMLKIADFLNAGCEVTILFANIHAYLDNMKTDWNLLEYRTKYYQLVIREILKTVGVSLEKLRFVTGADFQLKKEYTLDMYKLSALVSTRDTRRAGADVVKQLETPKMSGLLYPILQALDEQYLGVDAQFGGIDQRKLFMFAQDFLPKIGYKKRIHLMNYLIPGLTQSGKMSSSEPNSKIDFDEIDEEIKKKINKAYCVDGKTENNGLLAIARFIIFKILEYEKRDFVVNRPKKWGGRIAFKNYKELEKAFAKKELASVDLKQGIGEEIIKLVTPIRKILEKNKDLVKKAYP